MKLKINVRKIKNMINVNKLKEINKKKALVVLSGLLLVIFVLVIVIASLTSKTETLTCTREEKVIDFYFDETLIIDLSKVKSKEKDKMYEITNLDLLKTIEIGDEYNKFPNYDNVIKNVTEGAYGYLGKNAKVSYKDHKATMEVSLDIKKDEGKGLILDNFTFTKNSDKNKFDITFNYSKELESSATAYKLGDQYTKKTLLVKLEGLGYTCK